MVHMEVDEELLKSVPTINESLHYSLDLVIALVEILCLATLLTTLQLYPICPLDQETAYCLIYQSINYQKQSRKSYKSPIHGCEGVREIDWTPSTKGLKHV